MTGAFPGNFFAGVNLARTAAGQDRLRHRQPASDTGLGFLGNFLIRVTGNDLNCVPVELIEFTVKAE